ncbi:hypothetical protein [Egicoccus halophilus]|uniref:Uncharacterized protein n=1 Tax=Egicoccus halophilus TaxID=1670830 RepID=A0A8J3ESZ9_9ACTN|nr:hypothetical protein [Egicoccus halophilus]GGI08504.1 hypothetical protein GCM10011354_29410 [Egicoccus halophilus]
MTQATFRSSAAVDGPPGYRERSGQLVTIVEEVRGDQDPDAGDDDVATLYRVRFEDGVETEAFEDELELDLTAMEEADTSA